MKQMEDAYVFWDYENCPAPSNTSGYALVNSIRSMAQNYGDIKSLKAYLEIPDPPIPRHVALRSELQSSGVSLIDCPHNGRKDVADKMMIVDMLAHAIDNPAPSTIILISGDRDFAYAMSILRLRRYRIILCTLPNAHASLVAQASECVDWNNITLLASSGDASPKWTTMQSELPGTPFLRNPSQLSGSLATSQRSREAENIQRSEESSTLYFPKTDNRRGQSSDTPADTYAYVGQTSLHERPKQDISTEIEEDYDWHSGMLLSESAAQKSSSSLFSTESDQATNTSRSFMDERRPMPAVNSIDSNIYNSNQISGSLYRSTPTSLTNIANLSGNSSFLSPEKALYYNTEYGTTEKKPRSLDSSGSSLTTTAHTTKSSSMSALHPLSMNAPAFIPAATGPAFVAVPTPAYLRSLLHQCLSSLHHFFLCQVYLRILHHLYLPIQRWFRLDYLH